MKRLLALALAPALLACTQTSSIPSDRSIIDWASPDAIVGNFQTLTRARFEEVDQHACSADPTRVYIAELFTYGLDDIEVPWHWAPVIPGPDPKRPTLDQPEFFLAGDLMEVNDSGDDVLADHPFGYDVNSDILPDGPYEFLAEGSDEGPGSTLHTEVERRIFPRAALGFTPQAGDRALMKGVWILDCGHPPYGTEMHPPTFLDYARKLDAKTTISAAVVVPYRSSLLFNPNVGFATDFTNTLRFRNGKTTGFSQALVNAVLSAIVNGDDRLTTHALMTANRFDTLDWRVCAPLPRPPGATLDASWRFTTRTGVSISAARDEGAGCVRFVAKMAPDYVPMPLPWQGQDWPWADLSASASSQLGQPIDVRQAIEQILIDKGIDPATVPAVQEDHPPVVDAYPELPLYPGAALDSPTAIDTHADHQAFPFYGRVRVGWGT